MKLGILGTGKIVQEFLPWLVEHTPFTVQAVCSTPRSAAKAAELCAQYQIPQHTTNYFELLQWVDAVYIAVPNLQHARYARVALEAGKHVIVEKPMAVTAAETEELAALAQRKRLFLFEAMTTQYQPNYAKLRELLPRVGTVRMVQCSFSQYSSRYDAFCAGQTPPVFDPLCAGGALMDLGVYNVSYIVGLFGEPNKAVYAANMERNIDTSGVLMMDYSGFKAVSLAAKDCAAPARCIIQGTKGYILQKSTPNYCGGVTFHPNEGKEEHYNLNGDRPRQAAEFAAFYRAMTTGDPELCARQLSENVSMRNSIREAIKNGMPSVAECGGFMYLHESMTDEEGENWPMAGIIMGSCHNRGKLVRFGYVNVTEQTSHFLAGKPVRAHEFHYYDSDNNGESCVAVKPVSGTSWTCIHEDDRNWWGYPHLYYPSNPAFVEHFVQAARLYHRERNAK